MSEPSTVVMHIRSSWFVVVVVVGCELSMSWWSLCVVVVMVVGSVIALGGVVGRRGRGFRGPCALDRLPVPDRPIPSPFDCPDVVLCVVCVVACYESLPEGLS